MPPVMRPVSEERFHVEGCHDGTLILVFVVSMGGLAQCVAKVVILAERLLGLLDRDSPIGLNRAQAVAVWVKASLTHTVVAEVAKGVTKATAHVFGVESI